MTKKVVEKQTSKSSNPRSSSNDSTKRSNPLFLALGIALTSIGIYYLYPKFISTSSTTSTTATTTTSQSKSNNIENEIIIASRSSVISEQFSSIDCADNYDPFIENCTPTKNCGRFVMDNFIEKTELFDLVSLANGAMAMTPGGGGPTIFDLASGAITFKEKFVDFFKVFEYASPSRRQELNLKFSYFETYQKVAQKIKQKTEEVFGLKPNVISLTSPTFISKIENKTAVTEHDEYWHEHIDRMQYGSFVFTGLLYLNDFDLDYTGGKFGFVDRDANRTIEPVAGRLLLFSSGDENIHKVFKVDSGKRLALTIAFTCDRSVAVPDNWLEDKRRLFQ